MSRRCYPVVLAAFVLVCTVFDQTVLAEPPGPVAPPGVEDGAEGPGQNFWVRLGAWHHREVDEILAHVRDIESYIASTPPTRAEEADAHARLLDDARGMLRYAERIAPEPMVERAQVLEMRALVDELAGQPAGARAIYERLFEKRHLRAMPGRACVRYGYIEARLGDTGRARAILASCLEHAVGRPGMRPDVRRDATITLAHLHALDGRIDEGIRTLEHRIERGEGDVFTTMALVALQDRDGRISEALEVLERAQNLYENQFYVHVSERLAEVDLVPVEERQYMVALLLELAGMLPDAREAWQIYVRSSADPRAVARAREHVEAIDAMLDRASRD